MFFRRFLPSLWIWGALTCMFAVLATILLMRVFLSGTQLTRDAVDAGQRVTVHLISGETEGNMRHTRRMDESVSGSNRGTHPAGAASGPAVQRSGESLAPAPFDPISEQSDKGLIPVAGRDGTLPWKYYARPFTPTPKRPVVAVVLTNLGLSSSLTEAVLAMPHDFTLSFSPYAGDAKKWVARARALGFEAMMDIPMEPTDYPVSDPGPYGLLDNLDPNEMNARMHWILSRFSGYVGLLAPEDEKLTANPTIMRPVLAEFAARGLLFLYIKKPANNVIAALAKTHGFLVLGVDTVIDDEITSDAIEKQLATLTQIAKTQGYAIGFAHSYPPTTEALTRWAESLGAQGVDLVPLSAIARQVLP